MIKCPLCGLHDLYEIDLIDEKLYRCVLCTMDSDDFDYGEYMNQTRAFTEAIKDWI